MGTIKFIVDGKELDLAWEGTCTSITNLTENKVIEVLKDAQYITITDFSNSGSSVIEFSGDVTFIGYSSRTVTGLAINDMANLEKIVTIPEVNIDKARALYDIYIGGALREPIGDTLQYKEKSKRMLIGDCITQLFKDVYPESPKKRDIFAGFHKPDEDK